MLGGCGYPEASLVGARGRDRPKATVADRQRLQPASTQSGGRVTAAATAGFDSKRTLATAAVCDGTGWDGQHRIGEGWSGVSASKHLIQIKANRRIMPLSFSANRPKGRSSGGIPVSKVKGGSTNT